MVPDRDSSLRPAPDYVAMPVPENSWQFFPFDPLGEQEGRPCGRMRQPGTCEAQTFEGSVTNLLFHSFS